MPTLTTVANLKKVIDENDIENMIVGYDLL